MALVLADRVKETTGSTGTGDVSLAGATVGFQRFADAVGDGNTTYYAISLVDDGEFEVGLGTYLAATNSLRRDEVFQSSNNGSLVDFSTGTKDVFVVYPANRAVVVEGATVDIPNSATVPVVSGGTGANNDSAARSNLGLGSIATQNINNVSITGGNIDGVKIGETATDSGKFTTVSASGGFSGDLTGNADTATALETARDFSLTGDVTASAVSFDGTGNVTLNTSVDGGNADTLDGQNGTYYLDHNNFTNVPDPTLTLSGDVTGSATFTNLGNATLSATVGDDSHNHTLSTITDSGTIASQDADSVNIDGGTIDGVDITADTLNVDSGTLYVDSANNRVGIGTSSPSEKLHIDGSDETILVTPINYVNNQDAPYLIASASNYNGTSTNWGTKGFSHRIKSNSVGIPRLTIDDPNDREVFSIFGGSLLVGTTSTTINSSNFGTRIDSVGNVLLHSRNATSGVAQFFGSSGENRLLGTGAIQNTLNSYGSISDIKLKENIVDATPKLEKLNQVRIVNFNLIGSEQKQIGVIAQELEQIFPGLVDNNQDEDSEGNDLGTTTKSVKYSVFVPMLIKAIQEQQAIIESLEARVEVLENS